jgi:signal transduction histidine kinase
MEIESPPTGHSTVVLAADGTVLAALGGAPLAWLRVRLQDHETAPDAVRDAARKVMLDLHRTDQGAAAATVPMAGSLLHVTAIAALPIRRASIDFRGLLPPTMAVLRRQAEAIDGSLTLTIADNVPSRMTLDAEKVAWAITSLVGNALRYIRPGTRRMPGGAIAVQMSHDAAANEVTISVQDDGPGIPADRVTHLFDRNGRPQGSLALLLVRDIVVAHGGRCDVQSRTEPFDHGTTVRLTLPVR